MSKMGPGFGIEMMPFVCVTGAAALTPAPTRTESAPWCHGVAIDKAAIIVLRHEADFLAFGLARHAHTALRRHRSHLRLGILAEREAGVRQLLLVEYVQHIRLIFTGIDAPAQAKLAGERVIIHAHIMARRHVIGVERQGAIEQQGEADMAVAGQAGIGCAARHVFLVKEVHHVLFEFLLNVRRDKKGCRAYAPRAGHHPPIRGSSIYFAQRARRHRLR